MSFSVIGQITPVSLREFRGNLKLGLKAFWGAIGCTISRGHSYETGKVEVPEEIKRLIILHYVIGIPTDCSSDEFHHFVGSLANSKACDVGKAVKLFEEGIALLANPEIEHELD